VRAYISEQFPDADPFNPSRATQESNMPKKRDAHVVHHGSISLVHPLTKRAQRWIAEHVSDDAQFMGHALVVEPRYVADLLMGMSDDGLNVVT
jgi:hypothetical protein